MVYAVKYLSDRWYLSERRFYDATKAREYANHLLSFGFVRSVDVIEFPG